MDDDRLTGQPGPADAATDGGAPAGAGPVEGLVPGADTMTDEPDATSPAPDGKLSGPSEPAPLEIGWRGVGSAIGRSLDAYGSALPLFLALSVPVAILGASTALVGSNLAVIAAVTLVLAATGLVTGAAMMFATDDLGRGVRPTIADVLDRAAGRAIPLLLASLLVFLATVGLIVVSVVVAVAVIAAAGPAGSPAVGLGVLLVAILLVAEGVGLVILGVRWALSGQAVVLGGQGPISGLRQSAQLTRGHVRGLVRLYLALALVTILASAGTSLISAFSPNRLLAAIGVAASTLLTGPLLAITLATVYRDLVGRPVVEARPAVGRRWVAATLVVVGGLLVFSVGIWAVTSAGGQRFLPERGQVIAGASQNTLNPCHPDDVRTTFSTADRIWIAAIFTRHVPSNSDILVAYSRDGASLGSAALTASAQGLDCYYEQEPVQGALPGTYRITVTYGSAVIADGSFTVH